MSGPKIVISAGELSGDEHAAGLLNALRAKAPDLQARGMGGRNLQVAGMELIVDSEKEASVMGFSDVLASLGKILRSLKSMRILLQEWKPDLLILVDFPDFNLRLARHAKKLGIKVFYFIPPSVWAWRAKRVELLRAFTDHVALIYPFERDFYKKAKFDKATFVGHPFSDKLSKIDQLNTRQKWYGDLGLSSSHPVFAIFPGSRKKEIARYAPILGKAIDLAATQKPELQFVFALAGGIEQSFLLKQFQTKSKIHLTAKPLELLEHADGALLKSGTSNLQAAFYGIPFSMFFQTSKLSEFMLRSLINLNQYSIVNLVRANSVREIIQEDFSPDFLSEEILSLCYDQKRRAQIKGALAEVVELLNCDSSQAFSELGSSAYERTASLALNCVFSR